jgi:FkbM family methyltransferase
VLATKLAGWTLYYPSSSEIGQAVAKGEGWEPTLATATDLLLPRDEPLVIADVGSNIGTSVALMLSVRPSARFVCFEPSDRFRAVLNRTIDANGWTNVQVEEFLIGVESGTARLFTNASTASAAQRDYGGHVFLGADTHSIVRLDDYFARAERLDLIKTDTDGFDADVLLGAAAILEGLEPAIYFEFAPFLMQSAGREAGALLEYLGRLGYREFLVMTQNGHSIALTGERSAIIKLADEHKYVDLLTASRPAHVGALSAVAAATAAPQP